MTTSATSSPLPRCRGEVHIARCGAAGTGAGHRQRPPGQAGFTRTLAGFTAEHPELRLEIGFSDRREDVIGEGLDIAFRIGDLPDSSLRAKPVFRLKRQLVAAQALLAQHGSDHSRPRRVATGEVSPVMPPP
ncbi:MAG: hypothetical protein EOP35_16415 [Rubrivivax sp.]|nr:MAG: hypothetical protein EOP35_16415 [Rubrivivax sp.]